MSTERHSGLTELIERERQLTAAIEAARRRLDRVEELTEEDRAEAHTILTALWRDAQFAGQCLNTVLAGQAQETPRA